MIPLRATNYKLTESWPKYIILHHTAEFVPDVPKFEFDTPKFQVGNYMTYDYKVKKHLETNYHFMLDWVDNDYYVIVSQPLGTLCVYDDIPDKYKNSIHIAFIGNYDKDIPTNRLYKVLAYRLLAPLMRLFYLDDDSILFHSAISENFDLTCPGKFMDKGKIINSLNAVYRRRPMKRG